MSRLFRKAPPPPPAKSREERALAAVAHWQGARNEDLPSACRRALVRTLGSILNSRGRLMVDRDIIVKVATNLVMNRIGSARVGQLVDPLVDEGAKAEGYRHLPAQAEPVVLNAKGASASGKSSIRRQQRQIATRLGLDWEDFAIISPDYWRKALIDYSSLGEDHKYAAMMTGHELEVIDRKLDILMAVKAQRGQVPHMLVDRFRFDSFQTAEERAGRANLLTHYGSRVYMFYLVTPPAETVVRAWNRGIETGRYKAVDDLLYHNIEAYTGMPDLYFAWALAKDKWVHSEFLDNSVPQGQPPRSIAHGQGATLVVRDVERLCDIERFRHVDVHASAPDRILSRELSQADSMVFVRALVKRLDKVIFATREGRVWGQAENGALVLDPAAMPEGLDPASFGPHRPAEAPLPGLDPHDRDWVIGA